LRNESVYGHAAWSLLFTRLRVRIARRSVHRECAELKNTNSRGVQTPQGRVPGGSSVNHGRRALAPERRRASAPAEAGVAAGVRRSARRSARAARKACGRKARPAPTHPRSACAGVASRAATECGCARPERRGAGRRTARPTERSPGQRRGTGSAVPRRAHPAVPWSACPAKPAERGSAGPAVRWHARRDDAWAAEAGAEATAVARSEASTVAVSSALCLRLRLRELALSSHNVGVGDDRVRDGASRENPAPLLCQDGTRNRRTTVSTERTAQARSKHRSRTPPFDC